jgi:hypothetical protein
MQSTYTYKSILHDAIKVDWQVADLIGGNKQLDFTKPFLPEALVGSDAIECLTAREKLLLNQIRGKSYLHLFVLVEEFIIPMVLEQFQRKGYHDVDAMHALLCFAEEEGKHIHLFQSFATEFDRGFKTSCVGLEAQEEIAKQILAYHPLSVLLLTLQFEWTTQSHYLESIRDNHAENLDRCFSDLLKYHWLEEAQHTKLDTLLLSELVPMMSDREIETAIEDYLKLVTMLDDILMAQIQLDLVSLQAAIARPLTTANLEEIQSHQAQAYRWAFLCTGLTHPNFVKVLNDISPTLKTRVTALAQSLS